MEFCRLLVYNGILLLMIGDIQCMIEKLYSEMLRTLRNFTNSIDRKNKKEEDKIIIFLTEIINRVNFLSHNDVDCKILENRLIRELRKLSKLLFVRTNNKQVYLQKLQRNIDYLTWVNKQRNINLGSRKYTVAQKEIFYANLGDNIGSEQNGRRPVVILQNDTGNTKGNTTIITPVTTHQKRIKWDNLKRKYYIEIFENGIVKRKYLDFYEIPLKLKGKSQKIYGFVNVMHLREIDRKRIDSVCVGTVEDKCFDDIIKAINKNLS